MRTPSTSRCFTDLPNRLLLSSRLEHALERTLRHDTLGAVLFINLDRFKAVKDTFGHQAVDDLLRQVANRMRRRLRDIDTHAWLRGDEFLIVTEEGIDFIY